MTQHEQGLVAENAALRAELEALRNRQCLHQISEPAAVAVPDEREGFEAHIKTRPNYFDGMLANSKYRNDFKVIGINNQWVGWQARAALAATPAADAVESVLIDGTAYEVPAPVACELLYLHMQLLETATQAADAPAVPKWIDDPHDIEQGQMLNPEWVKAQEAAAAPAVLRDLPDGAPGFAAPAPRADARDADGMHYLQDARWSAMVGNCPSWWRPDGNGYTTNLDEAARFTFEEAMAQHRCRDTDLPWLCSEIDKLRRPTVDCQYMPRSWDAQRESIAAIAASHRSRNEPKTPPPQ